MSGGAHGWHAMRQDASAQGCSGEAPDRTPGAGPLQLLEASTSYSRSRVVRGISDILEASSSINHQLYYSRPRVADGSPAHRSPVARCYSRPRVTQTYQPSSPAQRPVAGLDRIPSCASLQTYTRSRVARGTQTAGASGVSSRQASCANRGRAQQAGSPNGGLAGLLPGTLNRTW